MFKSKMPLTALLILLLLLAACQSSNDKEEKTSDSGSIKLKVAGQHPDEHLNTQSLREIGTEIEEETDGKIELQIYPAGQLGDYTGIFEEVMKGTIDMALISLPSNYDPVYESIYIPYLANDYDEARHLYSQDSILFDILDEKGQTHGVKLLGFHADGFVGLSSTKEISDPLEMSDKDLLVRVPQLETFQSLTKQLGFKTMTIPYEDLYFSLQTNIIDASIGQSPNTIYHGFRDVVTHYYKYNSQFEVTGFIVNNDLWESFTDEEREVINDIVINNMDKSFDLVEEEDKDYSEKLQEDGIEVIEFSKEELDELGNKVKDTVWSDLEDTLGEETIQRLLEE